MGRVEIESLGGQLPLRSLQETGSDGRTDTGGVGAVRAVIWVAASPMYVPAIRRDIVVARLPAQGRRPYEGVPAGTDLDGAGGVDEIKALICSYGWNCEEALAVAFCESRFDPQAVSPDGANLGVFQVNVVHRDRVDGAVSRLLQADVNVSVAYAIYLDQGWGPWACKP